MQCLTDLRNKKFGRLKVIKRDIEKTKNKKDVYWFCKCSCGNEELISVSAKQLKSGSTSSCGCIRIEKLIELNKNKKKYCEYDLSGEYGIGYTTNTQRKFYFDLEDYDKIKDYAWIEMKNYVRAGIENGKKVFLHRFVYGETHPIVDHINHNTFDNRKCNLRGCTNGQNQRNRKLASNNSSGVVGVNWDKNIGKWRARICINGKRIELGNFNSFDRAVDARKKAEKKYFKKWAYDSSVGLNNIEE